ncbi:SDR family NAD(P)-dependent oxidoreductase [Halorientalis regularis]|jgi:3-oxoacyl-[acyl-carrier protein] reductase|uniref:NAD(P)-dependent dehydrogenase, short-chain alcohol dehydrogenase family n=1 Tax=Halorientalis regularis TaxID=660518 RepID=A0A1G7Q022_9EURY|nr:SDR family oxidoreductase [Halorientalis regularis]SDF91917.1 NAD(P)-dependent dehydrogenase, short-chain alcohol dehydrogenase family [Halorientalis regularis]
MLTPDLSGRTALVTGSAKGVGQELLLAIAACGADVAVHYRTSDAAAEEVAERAREEGVAATTVQADVTDPAEVDALFSAVEERIGAVDVLVNNVGAFAPVHWAEMDFETWNTVIETNLNGTYLCSKRALPGMREAGAGRIVNIGYASAERALVSPKNFPYFVAKTGVLMFTRMLAADTADDGITVNAVSPYVVENSDEFPEDLPRGRPAAFEDLIQPTLFFLAPDSDYCSGANVEVSGGWLPERV